MKDDERQADQAPARLQAMEVPGDFFRQVSRPDDQVLGEREIRPQHDERKHQIAEVVKMRGHDDLLKRRPTAQPHEGNDQERQGGKSLSSHDEHAINGRKPVRFERHEPVERREGDGQSVSDESARAQKLHPAREPRLAGAVLLERPGIQEIGQDIPYREIDDSPHDEKRGVQIQALVLQQLVARHKIGARPWIELVHAQQDRKEQHREHGQNSRRCTDLAPDDDAPGAA